MQAESLTNQADFDTDLFVCCSFRHGLRRATFLREEGFGFPRKPNLSLPPGEMSRSNREGWNQLTWLFKFALIRICQCAALSVICFANASSPKGRAKKLVRAGSLTNQGSLMRICLRAALSVTACAAPPSSGRKAFASRAIQLVSPFGRDVAQRQRGLVLVAFLLRLT